MRSLALVIDLADVSEILSGGPLDRLINVVLRHVLCLGIENRRAQRSIGIRIWPAFLGGHRDALGQFWENARHLSPTLLLGSSPDFKCSSHNRVTCLKPS